MYTRREIVLLAEALSRYTGIALSTLSTRACGNDKVFPGLAAGGDCRMSSAERASEFFDLNWPIALPWPDGVPKPRGRPRLDKQTPRSRGNSAVHRGAAAAP